MKSTDKQLCEEYFANHKIIVHEIMGTELGRLEYMRWQKPGTWNCAIDYTVKSGYLIVTGDLGEAIYCWYNPRISLEWIAGLDIGYFHGKTQASELGRSTENYEWDEEKAKQYIFEHFKDYHDCKGYKKFKELRPPIHDDREFVEWINNNIDDVIELFGQDYWDFIYGCGKVIPLRTRLHLIGLKAAFNMPIKK